MISIAIPIHKGMKNFQFFYDRCIKSIESQTYKDYEIVITEEGKMAENTNAAIKKSKGDLIKLLYMDDYLAHPNALQVIVDNFKGEWLATGCLHQAADQLNYEDPHSPHLPYYTQDIHRGNNCIGSPSVVTLRNKGRLLFDEKLSFLLDCDLYRRYYDTYGPPTLINDLNVVIGLHPGQTSNTMPTSEKEWEFNYLMKKYE